MGKAKNNAIALAVFSGLWQNKSFCDLSDDGKMLLFYLIGKPGLCPGIINETAAHSAVSIGWLTTITGMIDGIKRLGAAVKELNEKSFLISDFAGGIYFLKTRLECESLVNWAQYKTWIRSLLKTNSEIIIGAWIKHASFAAHESANPWPEDIAQATDFIAEKMSAGIDIVIKEMGIMVELDSFQAKKRVKVDASVIKEKTKNFNQRERSMWTGLTTELFIVPGADKPMVVADVVKDPIVLCERLAGNGFPLVDPSLIGRLAAWTFANPTRAKTNLARFLVNAFSRSQEKLSSQKQGATTETQNNRPMKDLGALYS